jgi:ribose transport system substrate-binding protein
MRADQTRTAMSARRFRAWLCASVMFAVLLGAVSCSRAPADTRPMVALVMKSLANEFFQTMEDGARRHQAQHATQFRLVANGIKDELDVARQVDIVEQMIAQRVSAIVLAPADSKALVPVAVKAQQAGIVVVNIDNRLDRAALAARGASIPFVGPDNRKGAAKVGDHLATKLKRGDAVAILEGAPNAFNGVERKLGFEDAAQRAGLRIVSSQTANWETSQASQVAAAMLTAHPQLTALLCANDSMALGAVAAVRDAGRTGQVEVVGFDNISAVRPLIADGRILATADQHGDLLAVYGIDYALETLKNKTTPADRETPVDLVVKQ